MKQVCRNLIVLFFKIHETFRNEADMRGEIVIYFTFYLALLASIWALSWFKKKTLYNTCNIIAEGFRFIYLAFRFS